MKYHEEVKELQEKVSILEKRTQRMMTDQERVSEILSKQVEALIPMWHINNKKQFDADCVGILYGKQLIWKAVPKQK